MPRLRLRGGGTGKFPARTDAFADALGAAKAGLKACWRQGRTAINSGIEEEIEAHQLAHEVAGNDKQDYVTADFLEELQKEMLAAAENLEFERAAGLRDQIAKRRGESVASAQVKKPRGGKGRRGKPR